MKTLNERKKVELKKTKDHFSSDSASSGENTFTKDDFTKALKKVSRPKKSA